MKSTEKTLDNFLKIFFSKDRTKLYVLIIFILGFVLRLINVINMPVSVDASGHALMAINFIDSGKIATWNQSVGLWHFLTDLSYKIFGVNDFSSRFFVLLFGSLSIILMFLFVKEVFGTRIGLIAAFLLAVSPFHITETIPEMDVMVMFFVLFGMLFFVKALKQDKKKLFLASGIFIGVGILVKIYALLFIPALVLFAFYYSKKHVAEKNDRKKLAKNVIWFIVIAGIFFIVPLAYNYLLYQDKGFVDYIFTGISGLGKEKSDQYYSWVVPYRHEYIAFIFGGSKIVDTKLPLFIETLKRVAYSDLIIIVLGLAGILIAFRKEYRDYLWMFLFILLTVYFYMGSISGLMTKHFMFLLISFVPLAALFTNEISKKINLKVLMALILIFQIFWLIHMTSGQFFEKSSLNQLVSYKKNIPDSSIVVIDGRIFRGIGTYIFSDKHYLESSYLQDIFNQQNSLPGNYQTMDMYFVECASDDCGWGTIKDQPEFNQSMETMVGFFKNNSKLVKTISVSQNVKMPFSFNIYKISLNLKPATLEIIDKTHIFWMNPLGYNKNIAPVFDDYQIYDSLDGSLNTIAHWILYMAVLISLLSIFILFYIFINQENETQHNNTSL